MLMPIFSRLYSQYVNMFLTFVAAVDDSSVFTFKTDKIRLLQEKQGRDVRIPNDQTGSALEDRSAQLSQGPAQCSICKR